jgi:hypothetical protein
MSELGNKPFQMIICADGAIRLRNIESSPAAAATWTYYEVTRNPNKLITSGVEKDGAIVVTTYEGGKQTDRRVIRGAKADE